MAQTVTFFIDEFSVGFYCRALRNEEISTHHTFRSQRCLDEELEHIFISCALFCLNSDYNNNLQKGHFRIQNY